MKGNAFLKMAIKLRHWGAMTGFQDSAAFPDPWLQNTGDREGGPATNHQRPQTLGHQGTHRQYGAGRAVANTHMHTRVCVCFCPCDISPCGENAWCPHIDQELKGRDPVLLKSTSAISTCLSGTSGAICRQLWHLQSCAQSDICKEAGCSELR